MRFLKGFFGNDSGFEMGSTGRLYFENVRPTTRVLQIIGNKPKAHQNTEHSLQSFKNNLQQATNRACQPAGSTSTDPIKARDGHEAELHFRFVHAHPAHCSYFLRLFKWITPETWRNNFTWMNNLQLYQTVRTMRYDEDFCCHFHPRGTRQGDEPSELDDLNQWIEYRLTVLTKKYISIPERWEISRFVRWHDEIGMLVAGKYSTCCPTIT